MMKRLMLVISSYYSFKNNTNMKVSLKKAFSIVDGRLSTSMGDVYEMLNYIFDENFFTNQLPTAMEIVRKENPKWFSEIVDFLNIIKEKHQTNDFNVLMALIDSEYSDSEFELGKIKAKIDIWSG